MKRLFALLLCILLFAACATPTETPAPEETPTPDIIEPTPEEPEERLSVIATTFPQYDFIRQIAGERVDVQMLIAPGAEAHAFEPTPSDMIALLEADLFIYTGGHGEAWMDTILDALDNEALVVVALMYFVEHLLTEDHDHAHDHHHDHGHSHGHHHDHGHNHGHDHHHDDHEDDCDACSPPAHDHSHSHSHDDHEEDCDDEDCDEYHCDSCDSEHHHHDYDEHVWTSPENAMAIVAGLTEVLAELDPENADFFRENAAAYITELEALEEAFHEVVAEAVRTTVVFGDRFPFRYLMHDLDLTVHAAFPGCSAETNASPATIAALIQIVRDEEIPVVFYTEFSNRMIANTIAEDTGATLLELHSAHNVSAADFAAGVTFLDIMWRNVEHLREALN